MRRSREHGSGLTLALVASFAVAACNQAQEKSYEADVEDVSGGELIVSEPDPDAVDVDLPETEMTNVPADESEASGE
ncbi:hypothetical protein [Altererythrobacter sp. GH1-8]|uniref:hypothetical protein n=1 Tax=Altererythrobacter sp. GH1-8 TaxID=3349333 RepID=UPI00374DBCF8